MFQRLMRHGMAINQDGLAKAGMGRFDQIAQGMGADQGTVVAGLSIMPHLGMLPGALGPFRQRYPGVTLKIIEGLYPAIEPGLRNGTIDFYMGAASQAAPSAGLIAETLFENTRIVVGRKGHPLAAARSLKELSMADWATPSLDVIAAEDLNEVFSRFKLGVPQIRLQANSAMSLLVALAHSDLLTMLPRQWADFPLTAGTLHDAMCGARMISSPPAGRARTC